MKRIPALILALALLLCACGQTTSSESSLPDEIPVSDGEFDADAAVEALLAEPIVVDSGDTQTLYQLEETTDDTPIVKMETSMGTITLALYPQAAPMAVENFLTHCENGYYDGVLFHRVIEDFMIQSGDPNGNGTGGESIWGGKFDDELSDQLHHFRGALSMANSGVNTNGSQFFIVQNSDVYTEDQIDDLMGQWYYNELSYRLKLAVASGEYTDDQLNAIVDKLNELLQAGVPDEYRERYSAAAQAYTEVGGYPYLDYGYTVFGQVIDGMDVVDAIAAVEVEENSSGEKSSPVEPVTILSTTVVTLN